MPTTAQEKPLTRYVYNLDDLARAPEGPCSAKVAPSRLLSGETLATGKSTTVGPVLSGTHVHIAWVVKPRGTGSKLHTHPNEQFNFVMKGTLIVDIDGQVFRVPAGHVVHFPAGMVHSAVAGPEEDVHFIAAKDTRHGIVGPAVDGRHNGPRTLPGFGTNPENEWAMGRDGLPVPQSPRVNAASVRYVYRWDELDRVPEGRCSAKVIPRGHVSGKSSSYGAALTGERIHVGLIHKARGSGSKLHTHPNEQFNIVLRGALQAEIDGQQVTVPTHHAIHMPTGIVHSCVASADGDVVFFVAKDTRHGLAGPPVDGIEDGPRYLPGFGPKK
ncbi:MAG: cupin domain-containing protein [Burkholderiales bacterium]|nr:cupin domain-containing protein [Burkholderiales bacterium]